MSNPHFFTNDDGSEDVTDEEREYFRKQWDNEDIEYGICPSGRFKLGIHSVKQIISCALKDIRLILGSENK